MDYLGTLDYAVISAYFIGLVVMGVVLQRLASSSMDSYFLAGKRLPWWMLGVSGMGYSLDIAGTMLTISLLWLLGPRGLYIEFRGAVSLALLCQMIWTGKWHRRSGCMTVAEWMTFRFGPGWAGHIARIATACCFIVLTIAMLTYMAKGVGLFLALFLPFTPFQCAFGMMGIAAVFTAATGLYGVVVSDLLQCGLIVLGVICVVFLAFDKIESTEQIASLAAQVTGQERWTLSFPNFHEPEMPVGYEQYEHLFAYAMVFLVINKLLIGGFGAGHEPQFFAARNERECGKLACLWAALMTFRWPMMMAYAILGLFLVQEAFPAEGMTEQAAALIKQSFDTNAAAWSDLISRVARGAVELPPGLAEHLATVLGDDWRKSLLLVGYDGQVNAERIMPAVLLTAFPSGLRGLVLVSLVSASMSTFDITVNKSAAMFTNDLYRRYLRPAANNRELLIATYAFCLTVVVIAFVLAYSVVNINAIWGWITMGLWSGIGIPLFLRFYWWRLNGYGYASGIFGGLLGAFTALVWNNFLYPESPLSEVSQFAILTPISLAFTVGGSLLTTATDPAVLQNFYRTTRPFGWWGPYRRGVSETDFSAWRREHRNDLLALPFGFVWMVTMYLLPMQLMLGETRAAAVSAALFVVGVVGLYRYWYLNLPAEEN